MKRIITLLIAVFFVSTLSWAQGDTNDYYWVHFTDKKGTPYSVGQPTKFLSQRSIERRQRLKIAVDSLDLPVSPDYIKALVKTGAKIHNVSKWLNGATVIATDKEVAKIAKLKFVDTVQRYNRRAALVDTTTMHYTAGRDTFSILYNKYDSNYYALAYSQIRQLNGLEVHRQGFEGQDVLIGVCDGGFPGVDTLTVFDSLRRSGRIVATRDFVSHRPSVYLANDHGTMVLTTMAGYIPGRYVGTAPKASYALCITEDTHTESPVEELDWVAAAEFLDSLGADVINSSLGYLGFWDTTLNHHYKDLDGQTAFMSIGGEIAATRGILCVNSAGNEGRNGQHSISVPADAEHILSVGAVWANGTIAGFSSYGSTYDNRVKPDVCAQGVWVYVSSPAGGYLRANGTSFSSPIMAGMMACLRQAAPTKSVADLCRAIRLSGSLYDQVNNRYGYGIPDCMKALRTLGGLRPSQQRLEKAMKVSAPKKLEGKKGGPVQPKRINLKERRRELKLKEVE
ncbi:MAG: S8 family serine peptidase [Bacteroidales bacterium]|nr:S8 family serine peptidase [Bacteroidales bacterium]